MINTRFMNLEEYIRSKVTNPGNFRNTVGICAGIAVSRLAPLPTSEMDNIEQHWQDSVAYEARRVLGLFNEQMAIDIDLAVDTARQFYMVRYTAAYCNICLTPFGAQGDKQPTFLESYQGASQFVSQELQAKLNAYPLAYASICNRIAMVMREEFFINKA